MPIADRRRWLPRRVEFQRRARSATSSRPSPVVRERQVPREDPNRVIGEKGWGKREKQFTMKQTTPLQLDIVNILLIHRMIYIKRCK